MNLLDKLFDKALEQKNKRLRRTLLITSSVADYMAGTYEEWQRHKSLLRERREPGGVEDYLQHRTAIQGSLTAEVLAGYYGMARWPLPAVCLLAGDLLVRTINTLVLEIRHPPPNHQRDDYWIGIIGTARSLGYKLADRLKRGESEADLEAEAEPEPETEPESEPEPTVDTGDSET